MLNERDRLIQAGFTPEEVREYAIEEANRLKSAGFEDAEVNEYLGTEFDIHPDSDEQIQYQNKKILAELDNPPPDVEQNLMVKAEADARVDALNKEDEAAALALADKFKQDSDASTDLVSGNTVAQKQTPAQEKPVNEVSTLGEAFQAGTNNSILGLALVPEDTNPVLTDNSPMIYHVAAGVAQSLGDLPTLILGAMAGAGAGLAGGPAGVATGAAAGAMGLTEFTRSILMDSVQNGSVSSGADYFQRQGRALMAGATGAVVGAVTGAAGGMAAGALAIGRAPLAKGGMQLVKPFAMPAGFKTNAIRATVEGAVATGAMALTQGRLPTYNELAVNGISTGLGLAASRLYLPSPTARANTDKRVSGIIADSYMRDGTHPKAKIEQFAIDLAARQEAISGNVKTVGPEAGKPNTAVIYSFRRNGVLNRTSDGWYHVDAATANRVADSVNNKRLADKGKAGADPTKDLDCVQVIQHNIDSEGKIIRINSAKDPDAIGIVRQYSEWRDDKQYGVELGIIEEIRDITQRVDDGTADVTELQAAQAKLDKTRGRYIGLSDKWDLSSDKDVSALATDLVRNMPEEFVQFLKTGKPRIGTEAEPVIIDKPVGIRIRNRLYMLDPSEVRDGSGIEATKDTIDVSSAKIEASVDMEGGKTPGPWFSGLKKVNEHLIDDLQALNGDIQFGLNSISYTAARLFRGVGGIAETWMTIGRSAFVPFQRGADGTMPTRSATHGKSLQEILQSARNIKDMKEAPALTKFTNLIYQLQEKSYEDTRVEVTQMVKDKKMTQKEADHMLLSMKETGDSFMGNDLSQLNVYLLAHRAIELYDRNIDSGIDIQAAKAVVDNPVLKARFEEAAQEIYSYSKDLVKYQLDSGLITKGTYDNIVRQNKRYIPLNRVMSDTTEGMSTGSYAISGSDRLIINPLESIIRQTSIVLRLAELNEVKKTIARDWAEDTPAPTPADKFGTLAEHQIANAKLKGASSKAMKTISYKEGGITITKNVPLDIWEATNNLDRRSALETNAIYKGLVSVAGVFRASTVLRPGFLIKDFIRNQFSAAINSTSGYKAFADYGVGLKAVMTAKGVPLFKDVNLSKLYADWLLHGGTSASMIAQDINLNAQMHKRLLRNRSPHNTLPLTSKALGMVGTMLNPLRWPKSMLSTLRSVADGNDAATRLGEFKRAREAGLHAHEAAFLSREIGLDFARMGASMRAVNALVAFTNAAIQGTDKQVRTLITRPGETMARVTAGIILPSMLLAMVRNDIIHNDPDSENAKLYKNMPSFERNSYWHIPTAFGMMRIPKPFDYAQTMANPLESFIDHIYDNTSDKSFLARLYDDEITPAILNQFFLNPTAWPRMFVPTAVAPGLDLVSNYNFFRNTPIVTANMERLYGPARYTPATSETAKAVSLAFWKVIPQTWEGMAETFASPIAIDYLVRSYTGEFGQGFMKMCDMIMAESGTPSNIEKPDRSWRTLPIVKEFFYEQQINGKQVSDFYRQSDRLEKTYNTRQTLAKSTDPHAREIVNFVLAQPMARFDGIRTAMGACQNMIKAIHYLPDMSGEEKALLIDQNIRHLETLAEAGLQLMNEIRKTAKKHDLEVPE